MNVQDLAAAYQAIEQTQSRLAITKILAQLFLDADSDEARVIAHLSRGQLYPPYSSKQFFMADKMMVRVLAQFLGEQPVKILAQFKKSGDIGTVLCLYPLQESSQLAIMDLYAQLIALADISGEGSQEEKINHLCLLLEKLDALSARYVVRIITGKLRLGFSDMTIIDALSWMLVGNKSLHNVIEDAYNYCADIGLIAYSVKKEGIETLEKMKITVGIPFIPAAAERLANADAIIEKIGPAVAQPKLDGFRLQIHVSSGGISFFSRNLQNMSSMFPELMQACAALDVDTLICEGEAIAYDQDTGAFLPFQETVKRRRKHDIDIMAGEFPLKIFLFDILYLNGKALLSLPHCERRRILTTFIQPGMTTTINVIDEMPVRTAKELEAYFFATISAGLEGVIVKRPDSLYKPGKRNFNWIKLKRVQVGQLEDTIDCVILGYYQGEGKRSLFGIGAFLVGVYNKQEDIFQTIAKVGTGLRDEQWKDLKKRCDSLAVSECPHNVMCPSELKPDVWVSPDNVCAILADEISLSPLHTAGKTKKELGYALRFPRFMEYRPDKNAYLATTVAEISHLYQEQFAYQNRK